MALQELVNETPINTVAIKYKCTRGMLQSLQQMASTFAGIVTSFCNSLQWDTLSLIVSQFKERLYFGIHRDLIDLMRLPDLNHKRARALFDAGITSLVELAGADILEIEKILYNALSFDSTKKHDNENEFEAAQRNEARNFFITGKSGLTVAEAAKLLIQEARQFVQYEIGVGNIKWSQSVCENNPEDNKNDLHMSYEENKYHNVMVKYNLDQSTDQLKNDHNTQMKKDNEKTKSNVQVPPNSLQPLEKFENDKENVNKQLATNAKNNEEILKQEVPNFRNNKILNNKNSNILKSKAATELTKEEDNRHISEIKTKQINEIHMSIEDTPKVEPLREKNVKDINQQTQAQSKENDITFEDDSKFLKIMEKVEEKTKSKMKNIPNKIDIENNKTNTKTIKRKSSENSKENLDVTPPKVFKEITSTKQQNIENKVRKSSENVKENLDVTPKIFKETTSTRKQNIENKVLDIVTNNKTSTDLKEIDQISGQQNNLGITPPNPIKQTNNIDNDEKPTTSKKAQRLLRAKQLSEMKKQEWAQRRDQEEKQLVNTTETKTPNTANVKESRETKQLIKTPESKTITNSANLNNQIINSEEKSNKSTPTSVVQNSIKYKNIIKNSPNTPKQDTPKLPRRSPRNHLISSTRIEDQTKITTTKSKIKSPENDLFGNEESFTINTGIQEALKEADNFKRPSIPEFKNNSPEDEIPSSQQLIEEPLANKTNSPHGSRFLRSLRATQKMQSPKTSKTEISKLTKAKIPEKPKEPPSSTSIELSDLSMENSLIKNPIQLNASHILSCSKVDTESSSFKSLDIIDICGDQQLFKGAFKEFMANKRLGFCLGLQQQSGKRKPVIGANLLLNQMAAAEKENEIVSYEFQIDDANYLAGISFCISENVVYYMNMQAEGSCKGLTGEIKCKYLRMLLRSAEHTLLIYDAKEQMKVLRKILKDIGEISVALEDPKIANWLLQPDKNHNLHSLVS